MRERRPERASPQHKCAQEPQRGFDLPSELGGEEAGVSARSACAPRKSTKARWCMTGPH